MFRNLKNNQRARLFVVLIVLLALFLRVYKLDSVPPGFWFDEASFGYSAYSVLETGRDEFGEFFPLTFKSFGQYVAGLHVYWLIPFIKLFGLTVFGVRLASAILGVFTTYSIYLLGRELFEEKIGLLASFIFAISPFALQFNRMKHENNLMVLFLVLGAFLLIKGFKKGKCLFMGVIFLALSIYSYLAARAFTPLLVILFIFLWKDKIIKKKKECILAGFLLLLLILPFLKLLTTPVAWPRVRETSILADAGVVLNINKEVGEHGLTVGYSRILHNKLVGYSIAFTKNYLSHLDPEYFLFNGDPVEIYNTPGTGIMHIWEYIGFLLGIYILLFKYIKKESLFIVGWFFLGLVPASLTRFVPSASRSFQITPATSIISAVGLFYIWNQLINKSVFRKLIIIISFIVFFTSLIYYFDNYYVHLPKRYAYDWRKGVGKVIREAQVLDSNYKKVIVDQEGVGYISYLFFTKYPPEKIQQEAKLTVPDEFGFSYIPKIGKYYFVKDFPKEMETNVLYIGRRGWIGDRGKIIERVNETSLENEYLFIEK